RVPEHAEAAALDLWRLADLAEPTDGGVHAEVLVGTSQQLHQTPGPLLERSEVLDQVEQLSRLASAAEHRLQRHDPWLGLVVDLLPLGEVLPARGHRADLRLLAVREDDEPVGPEHLRDR